MAELLPEMKLARRTAFRLSADDPSYVLHLAVHPGNPQRLAASSSDFSIKLYDKSTMKMVSHERLFANSHTPSQSLTMPVSANKCFVAEQALERTHWDCDWAAIRTGQPRCLVFLLVGRNVQALGLVDGIDYHERPHRKE